MRRIARGEMDDGLRDAILAAKLQKTGSRAVAVKDADRRQREVPKEGEKDDSGDADWDPSEWDVDTSTETSSPTGGCNSAETVAIDDVRELGRHCKINLGSSSIYGEIAATVPSWYEAEGRVAEMKEDLLPRWYERVSPDAATWQMASRGIDYQSDKTAGLFWSGGWGFYHQALLHAVVTLHAYTEFTDDPKRFADTCEMNGDQLLEYIESGSKWLVTSPLSGIDDGTFCRVNGNAGASLTVDADGRLTASRTDSENCAAWGWFGKVHLCDLMRVEAAIADYYFYWAHRLHGWVADGHGDLWDWYVAVLCARAALTEIVELAAVILHEYGHVASLKADHCSHCTDWLTVGATGDPGDWGLEVTIGCTEYEGHDCCTYMLEYVFRHRMYAELGLPISHLVDIETDDTSENRFDDIRWSKTFRAGSNCTGTWVNGVHCDKLSTGHKVDIEWQVLSTCSTMSDDDGGLVYGVTSTSCR